MWLIMTASTCRIWQVMPPISIFGECQNAVIMQTNRLHEIRTSHGLRQADVASRLGHASPDRISHWEKGLALPGLINLLKLSIIYNVPPEQFYPDLYRNILKEMKLGSNPLSVDEEGIRDTQKSGIETALKTQSGL
jgi:transcriptional regulator with XRE-family HTH domain